LSGGRLPGADLSGADLSGANLSDTQVLNALIIGIKFSDAIVNEKTDFSGAVVDNPDFLKHLREKRFNNIPAEI
jgi:uncharacterized protein YjbI with pentapeptide repeats